MTEGRRYIIIFEQFARIFGFGRNDVNHYKIHYALRLDTSKMRSMYLGEDQGNLGEPSQEL
jgi:hypothetical protein